MISPEACRDFTNTGWEWSCSHQLSVKASFGLTSRLAKARYIISDHVREVPRVKMDFKIGQLINVLSQVGSTTSDQLLSKMILSRFFHHA